MKLQKSIEITSKKYDVTGRIDDYGYVIKLIFSYKGLERTIDINRPLNGSLADKGLKILETAVDKLIGKHEFVYMHYWSIFRENDSITIHGIVTGHPKYTDTSRIYATSVLSAEYDVDKEEMIVKTKEAVFRCPMDYCSFKMQDMFPELIKNYEELKERYINKRNSPEIEQGKVLLTLSDFDAYYFHTLCVKDKSYGIMEYFNSGNLGKYHNRYQVVRWIETYNTTVVLRYYPHFRNIELYEAETDGMPLYVENIGYNDIYVVNGNKYYRIKPNERKELSEENAEKEKIEYLPDGNLYPTGT